MAKEVVYSHHKKWNGSGYPQGLVGDEINIATRLMGLADVYDALISARIYKPGMHYDTAAKIIAEGRGKHFDPEVVDAFLALSTEFQTIAVRYAYSESDLAQKVEFRDSVFNNSL